MNGDLLNWHPVAKRNIFSTRVFDIHEITSRSPENTEGTFYALHAADWVIVVPVLTGKDGIDNFILVRQWRHGSGTESLEFPGGVIDPGETPETAAIRELREETGCSAGHIERVATLSPNPAIMDNQCHIFIAEQLERNHSLDLDDDEYIATETVPVMEAFREMGHGQYIHGLMSAAFFLYIQKKGLPS